MTTRWQHLDRRVAGVAFSWLSLASLGLAQAAGLGLSSTGVVVNNRTYGSPITCTLTATADTYIRSDQTGNSFGTQTTLDLNAQGSAIRRSFVSLRSDLVLAPDSLRRDHPFGHRPTDDVVAGKHLDKDLRPLPSDEFLDGDNDLGNATDCRRKRDLQHDGSGADDRRNDFSVVRRTRRAVVRRSRSDEPRMAPQ